MNQMLNTLNISDFISKCTNYIYIYTVWVKKKFTFRFV